MKSRMSFTTLFSPNISGSRFQVLQQATYPVGWFECLQETGSAAVVGTKALLSPNMIATGNRAAPMPS